MTHLVPTRVAAALHWFVAVAFGVPCISVIHDLLMGRDLPVMMGFRAFGGGFFERFGPHTMVLLLVAFLLVCILEAVAGILLWGGRKSGAVVSLLLLPLGGIFWWGFALPIPPILALAWTVLILLNGQVPR